MNMKKLIESMDHIEECGMAEGPMGMAPPAPEMDKGNPVTVNVSMNASGKEHVADLLDMMKNAGLGDAEPAADAMMSPRMDMERLSGIMSEPADGLDDKAMSLPAPDDIEGSEDESYANEMDEGQFKREMTDDAQELDLIDFVDKYRDYGEEEASAMWHDMNEEAVAEMQPKDPNSVEVRVGNDINDILNGASDGQDMSDQIDALSQKWLGGDEIEDDSEMHDAIRLVVYTHKKEPDEQAEAAEEALSMIDNPTEAATEDMSSEGTYTIKVKGKDMDSQNELARIAQLSGVSAPQEMETEASGDYANEPDEQYSDLSAVIPDGDDLHKQKKSHPAVSGGDNPMAIENIKAALYAALTEKKMPMGAGPDGKKGTGDDKPAFLNQKGDSKKKKGGKPKKGVNPFK